MAKEPPIGDTFGRLTRSREFEALRRGKRVQAGFGRLQGIARTGGVDAPFALRFGLVVPKRLGNAPRRNRIKRLLREGMRCASSSPGGDRLRSAAGVEIDIGIFPSVAVLDMSFEALCAELGAGIQALMRKLGRHPI